MDRISFFRGQQEFGPTTLALDGRKAQLTCTVVEEWIRRKAWSIACGEKRRYVLKKRLGVTITERSELESAIKSSLKLSGISELKSEIRTKLGFEFRVEESQEEEDEFSFEAPKCGRVDYSVYQLKRLYEFIYKDRRSWLQRFPCVWADNSFNTTIEEWVDAIYSMPEPTDPDPACKCRDPKPENDGLINLWFDKLGMLVGYKYEGRSLVFPTLGASIAAEGIGDILYNNFTFNREAIPSYLLFLADERASKLTGQFRPYIPKKKMKGKRKASVLPKEIYLLIGGCIGATLALLIAPKSGRELQSEIADAERKSIDRSLQAAQQRGERAREYYEATRKHVSEVYEAAVEEIDEATQAALERVPLETTAVTAATEDELPVDVSEEERRLHNDARRFARLLVSEIKLYNEQRVKEGRSKGDIYERLREDIDRSRQMYDKRVAPPVAARFDYFHQELVNTLAEGDSSKLGESYLRSRHWRRVEERHTVS